MRRWQALLLIIALAVVAVGARPARAQDWCTGVEFLQNLGSQGAVYSLTRTSAGSLLAGTGNASAQIWRSVDDGQSWTLAQTLGTQTHVYDMLDAGGGVLVAGTGRSSALQAQIWRSTDDGQSWTLAQAISGQDQVRGGVVVGLTLIFATAWGGQIWRSVDTGQTWVQGQTLATTIFEFANPGVLITGGDGLMWRSVDTGQTWVQGQTLTPGVDRSPSISSNGSVVVAGTGRTGQIWRSVDTGQTWTLAQQLAGVTWVNSVRYVGSGVWYAGTTSGWLWRSVDDGQSWVMLERLGSSSNVRPILNMGAFQLVGIETPAAIYQLTTYRCPTPTPAPSGTPTPTTQPLPTATFVPVATVVLELSNVISTTSSVMIAQTEAWALDAPTAPLFLGLAFFVFVFGFILIIKRMFTP